MTNNNWGAFFDLNTLWCRNVSLQPAVKTPRQPTHILPHDLVMIISELQKDSCNHLCRKKKYRPLNETHVAHIAEAFLSIIL